MDSIKVLYLDDDVFFNVYMKKANISFRFIGESSWGELYLNRDRPEIWQKGLEEVAAFLTANKANVYFTVIGNNMGFGLELAKLIPDELKEKTIVVWNRLSSQVEVPYVQMGFQHFSTRREVGTLMAQLI